MLELWPEKHLLLLLQHHISLVILLFETQQEKTRNSKHKHYISSRTEHSKEHNHILVVSFAHLISVEHKYNLFS